MSKPKIEARFVAVPVGVRVTCRYRAAHQGTVLAYDDPRCWANSLAFPTSTPDPAAVKAHVARCMLVTGPWEHQPVLWDFGNIYWDHQLEELHVADAITDEERCVHA